MYVYIHKHHTSAEKCKIKVGWYWIIRCLDEQIAHYHTSQTLWNFFFKKLCNQRLWYKASAQQDGCRTLFTIAMWSIEVSSDLENTAKRGLQYNGIEGQSRIGLEQISQSLMLSPCRVIVPSQEMRDVLRSLRWMTSE